MPRSIKQHNNLSEGWHRLYKLWKLDLNTKVRKSHQIIKKALRMVSNPIVCWSGGKDSTVVLHLLLHHCPDIPVFYVNSGVDFPESKNFVYSLAEKWRLNLQTVDPPSEINFWDIGIKYGWPIFGKNISSNVERAVRTGNIRKQLSKLEKFLAENKLHISTKCSEILQEKTSKIKEKEIGCDLKFIGLRAEESRARVRLWVDYGDVYYVKRYYKRNEGIYKASPISIFTDKDIWKYHNDYNIQFCDLYTMGYPRNGCWCCGMAVRNGQLKRLRVYHPHLFRKLLFNSGMGEELLKAKKLLCKLNGKVTTTSNNLRYIMKKYPEYFDTF